ncbi:MAG TPA: zinc-ribbon and DUF3426 domain-containing protein [Steroidobacteraceae bacterium]|jgi:predicted Zn finger-like uncharacterized protein
MFTVCPKCTLTLAVTAVDLRTGQGYVRCGRCLNVFNALLALSEEPAGDGTPTPVYSQADPASSSQISAALASSANDAGDFDADFEDGPETRGHAPNDSAPRTFLTTERSSDGAIENESSLADGTGSYETIVLEGDAITQTEEFVPEESIDSEIAALTQRLSAAHHEYGELAHAEQGTAAAAAGESPASDAPAPPESGADADTGGIVVAPPPRRAGWVAGCAVLALLLAMQAVNHWRDALASSPTWSAPVGRLYAGIGVPLDPHWNLAAYDVRQQGATADPSDSHIIHVRLSLANREQRAQPVPLLRMTLLDRYGKPIAARDLTPAEYWPAGHLARSMLAHDERIDSEIALRDPAADSASFEIDVCLKNYRGVVRCAGDTTAAAAPIP